MSDKAMQLAREIYTDFKGKHLWESGMDWNEERIAAILDAAIAQAVAEATGELRDDILQASDILADHIEQYHDIDHAPEDVPAERQSLRNIQHHLMGVVLETLSERKALAASTAPASGRVVDEIVE